MKIVCNKWNRMSPDQGAEDIKNLDILTTSSSIGVFMIYSYMHMTSGIDMENKYLLTLIGIASVSNATANYLWSTIFPDDERVHRNPNVNNARISQTRRERKCLLLSAPKWYRNT